MYRKYECIMADPPWHFRPWSNKGDGRNASNHYQIQSLGDLKRMQIPATESCALFMWVSDPMLKEAMILINAWGFTYKTVAFTWVKTRSDELFYDEASSGMGMGYWTRSNPEMCLLATRGRPQRIEKGVRQLIIAPRREHSRKPDEVYGLIERLVPGPYLEIFARHMHPGWDSFGQELGKF